jgi:hypothetical protein
MPHPDASRPSRPDLLHFAELAACGNTDADRLAAIASALLDGATFTQALRAVREDDATHAQERRHDDGASDRRAMSDDDARALLRGLAQYALDYAADLPRELTVRELAGDLIDSLPRGESAIDRGAREAIERVFGRDALTR